MSTNYSTMIFLINETVIAIKAVYEPLKGEYIPGLDTQQTDRGTTTPVTTFKTFDKNIKVGDLLLVPSSTRFGVTTVKVVEVGIEVDIESPKNIDWVIGVVDKSDYSEVLAYEAKLHETVKAAEKTDRKNKLKEKVFAHLNPEAIASLQIAHAKPGDGGLVIDQPSTKDSAEK